MSKMAQDILVLEPDIEFAAQLVEALNQTGSFSISVVPTVKEACWHLVQSPKELAFVPVHEGAKIIRSLRAIQPDLRLILVTPTADVEIPITYSGRVQGVLIKPLLAVELPIILNAALSQPFFVRENASFEQPKPGNMLDTAVLITALRQAELGHFVKTAVFARDDKLLAHWGELNEREAATVALHVGKGWADTPYPDRLQFLHLPARAGDLLLSTRQITHNYLLTLVAVPETPIHELRKKAQPLANHLADIVTGRTTATTHTLRHATRDKNLHGRLSYAIVWRPLEPLADALETPLRQALLRLAGANGCVLNHTHIQPDLIHIVATCPPERDAGWVANLFKNGSEQIIQQEYGVVVNLWEAGFYATEASKPLSKVELNLFLEHSL
jgi:hypothetical protein